MNQSEIIIAIILMAVVVFATRSVPFVFFHKRKAPELLLFIEKYIPAMVVLLLVMYCLIGTSFSTYPYGIPEIFCVGIVAALHYWKENTLLSVGVGTITYMIIVQSGIAA